MGGAGGGSRRMAEARLGIGTPSFLSDSLPAEPGRSERSIRSCNEESVADRDHQDWGFTLTEWSERKVRCWRRPCLSISQLQVPDKADVVVSMRSSGLGSSLLAADGEERHLDHWQEMSFCLF